MSNTQVSELLCLGLLVLGALGIFYRREISRAARANNEQRGYPPVLGQGPLGQGLIAAGFALVGLVFLVLLITGVVRP